MVVEVVVGHLRNRSFSHEQPTFFFDFFEEESSGASDFGVPGGVTNGTGLERRDARDNMRVGVIRDTKQDARVTGGISTGLG